MKLYMLCGNNIIPWEESEAPTNIRHEKTTLTGRCGNDDIVVRRLRVVGDIIIDRDRRLAGSTLPVSFTLLRFPLAFRSTFCKHT